MKFHVVTTVALTFTLTNAIDNGLGKTPQMGYNTWYDFMCNDSLHEDNIRQTVDEFVKLGLPKYGYEYINLDDCIVEPTRGDDDKLRGDLKRFPSGMRQLSDYVHDKGLLFGVYTDRGNATCANLPAALGNEELDAQTYVNDWNVDYIKEDSCFAPVDHDVAFEQYGKMRDALNSTGKPVFFSLCGWEDWYAPEGANLGNSWRTGPDDSNWGGVKVNIDIMANGESSLGDLASFAGPDKGWNDPCLLLSSDHTGKRAMSEVQTRTQFGIWSVLSSPLLISGSILTMSDYDKETYTNADVIAVNQDLLGKQGSRLIGGPLASKDEDYEGSVSLYAKSLSGDDIAFIVINSKLTDETFVCDSECFRKMGVTDDSGASIVDLWSKKTVAYDGLNLTFDLDADGGSRMFRIKKE